MEGYYKNTFGYLLQVDGCEMYFSMNYHMDAYVRCCR